MGHYRHGQRTTTNLFLTFPGKKSGLACHLGEHLLRISQHLLDNALSLVIIGARCQHGPVARNVHAEDPARGPRHARQPKSPTPLPIQAGSSVRERPSLRGPTSRFSYPGAPVLAIGGGLGLCINPADEGPRVRILLLQRGVTCEPDVRRSRNGYIGRDDAACSLEGWSNWCPAQPMDTPSGDSDEQRPRLARVDEGFGRDRDRSREFDGKPAPPRQFVPVVMGERCVEPLGDRPHWPARRRVSAVG